MVIDKSLTCLLCVRQSPGAQQTLYFLIILHHWYFGNYVGNPLFMGIPTSATALIFIYHLYFIASHSFRYRIKLLL